MWQRANVSVFKWRRQDGHDTEWLGSAALMESGYARMQTTTNPFLHQLLHSLSSVVATIQYGEETNLLLSVVYVTVICALQVLTENAGGACGMRTKI